MCFHATHCPLPHHGWTRHLALLRALPASAAAKHLRDLFFFPPLSSLGNPVPFLTCCSQWHHQVSDRVWGRQPQPVEVMFWCLPETSCQSSAAQPSLGPVPTVLCPPWAVSELFPFRGRQKSCVHAPSEPTWSLSQGMSPEEHQPCRSQASSVEREGRTSLPGTGFIITGAMLPSRSIKGTCHSVLNLRVELKGCIVPWWGVAMFQEAMGFWWQAWCDGWLPIQALDHSSKVNLDGVESKCWPASPASHPCPDPLRVQPWQCCWGRDTWGKISFALHSKRWRGERERNRCQILSCVRAGGSFPFAL